MIINYILVYTVCNHPFTVFQQLQTFQSHGFKQCPATSNQNTSPGPRSGEDPCGTHEIWEKNQSFRADAGQIHLHYKINSSNLARNTLRTPKSTKAVTHGFPTETSREPARWFSSSFATCSGCKKIFWVEYGICIAFPPLQLLVIKLFTRASIHQGRNTPVKPQKIISYWSQRIAIKSSACSLLEYQFPAWPLEYRLLWLWQVMIIPRRILLRHLPNRYVALVAVADLWRASNLGAWVECICFFLCFLQKKIPTAFLLSCTGIR